MISIIMLPDPFQDLPDAALTRLTLEKGAYAFRQDDVSQGLFYVMQGEVTLTRHTEAGHQIVLHRAPAGETFAEASLFSKRYHCDCIASSDSLVVRLGKAQMLAALQHDPQFALALMRRFAGQVQGYRRHLEVLAIKGAEDRILAALADFGQKGTVMAFAASIGLTHEVTYRALSALTKQGVVRRVARGRYQLC